MGKESHKEFCINQFGIKREMETLSAMVETAYFMKRGYMPILPITKKAVQEVTKELCTAICEYVNSI